MMKIDDAIRYLQRNEAWHVVRDEYIQKTIEQHTNQAMQPINEPSEVYARERSKAAAAALKLILSHFEATVHAKRKDDEDASD